MIVNRPLSSVVAVYVVGPMFGLSAVTVAPLMAFPESSLTRPLTRPTWAAAVLANNAVRAAATTTCR